MKVTSVDAPADRSRICRQVLAELPGWFGLPDANERYVREVARLVTFAVAEDAFLSLKPQTEKAAEIYVTGIRPTLHRRGMETAILQTAEEYLRARNFEYLQVKTLGPSRPSSRYETTRKFYEARGFVSIEEFEEIWGPDNPCLLLVEHLTCR